MSGGRFVFIVMLICQSKCFCWKFESDLIIIKHVLTQVYVRNAPQTINKEENDGAVAAADDDDNDDDDCNCDDMRLTADNLKRSKK